MFKNAIISSLFKEIKVPLPTLTNLFHKSAVDCKIKWLEYNKKVYPPQTQDETPRPAYVCHCKENIKYSPKKLWYIASLVRGMTIDEALKQLQFLQKKGAVAIKETILEAQKMAVEDHNVEFKSNLWVSESFVGKGMVIKGLRRGARGRMKQIKYRYCHYFLTLEEGKPPKDYYYYKREKSGEELFSEWLEDLRRRKILRSL